MKAPFLAALLSLAMLSACNSQGPVTRDLDNGLAAREAGATRNGSANAPAPAAGPPGSVEQQVAELARKSQGQVPIQLGQGATITAIEARGTQLVTALTLPADLTQATADRITQAMTAQQCADPRLAEMIQRGGRLTWSITDAQGEKFEVSTSRC